MHFNDEVSRIPPALHDLSSTFEYGKFETFHIYQDHIRNVMVGTDKIIQSADGHAERVALVNQSGSRRSKPDHAVRTGCQERCTIFRCSYCGTDYRNLV